MFEQLARLINNQLSILVFWDALGVYFSNVRFSIFRLTQISSLYPFTDYSMNKEDITSSTYQWSSRITSSTHHLISRRSSVCSWPCLSIIAQQKHRRELGRFSFSCLASLGLTKTIILSGGIPSSIVSFLSTLSQYPSPLMTRFALLLIISLLHLASFLF